MTTKKSKSGKLSRREFLKDAGLLAGGAAIGSTVLLAACTGEPETTTITQATTQTVTGPTTTQTVPGPTTTVTAEPDPKITVLNPEGQRDPIELKQLAPRLTTLEGKTIYVVSVNFTATDNFLISLRNLFEERIPSATAIFKVKRGNYGSADIELWDEVEANADAFVMAVGH